MGQAVFRGRAASLPVPRKLTPTPGRPRAVLTLYLQLSHGLGWSRLEADLAGVLRAQLAQHQNMFLP